jgi:hypothetical protein
MAETSEPAPAAVDLPTLIAISALAYAVCTQLHEGAGHGGACLAVHGRVAAWGAYYVDCNTTGLPAWAGRVVAAAGSAMNLATAIAAWLVLRVAPPGRSVLRFFLWLVLTISLLDWAGYFLFSGVSGFGDWGGDGVFKDVEPQWLWRIGLTLVGGLAYYGSARFAAHVFGAIAGGPPARRRLMRTLQTTYLTGGVLAILIGLLNPMGLVIVLLSAAASSFGGTSGLLYLGLWVPRTGIERPLILARSWAWIVIGVGVVALEAVVLGPTLRF